MDFVKWEEDYGKKRVTVGELRKKQVMINGMVRKMKRSLKDLGFKSEVIKGMAQEYESKLKSKTEHLNFVNQEFEQALLEQRMVLKQMINDMVLLNSDRWIRRKRSESKKG